MKTERSQDARWSADLLYWLLLLAAALGISGLVVAMLAAVSPPPDRVAPAVVMTALTIFILLLYVWAIRTGGRRFDPAIKDDLANHSGRYWGLLVFLSAATAAIYVSVLDQRLPEESLWDQLWDPLITVLTFLTAVGLFVANRVQVWEAKLPRRIDAHYRLITATGVSVPILSLHRAELSGESDIRTYAQGVLQGLKSEWRLGGSRGAMRPYFDIQTIGAASDEGAGEGAEWFFLYRVTLFLKPGAGGVEINQWPGYTKATEAHEPLPAGWGLVPMEKPKPPGQQSHKVSIENGQRIEERSNVQEVARLRDASAWGKVVQRHDGDSCKTELYRRRTDPAPSWVTQETSGPDGSSQWTAKPRTPPDDTDEAQDPGYVVWTRLQADYPAHDAYYICSECAKRLDPQKPEQEGDKFLRPPKTDWFTAIRDHDAKRCGCNRVLEYSEPGSRTTSYGEA